MASQRPLANKLILLIDSDDFLSSYIATGLRAAGGTIMGPARNFSEALQLVAQLRTPPDAAVVNLVLEGGSPTPVIEILSASGVKVVLTGNYAMSVPAHLQTFPLYRSPFASYQIAECVEELLANVSPVASEMSGPAIRGH
jgi:hypothetical protein